MNVDNVLSWLNDRVMSDDEVGTELMEFFSNMPAGLDLASALYYLKREFKSNNTGIDYRTEIYTAEPDSYSGYDDDEDDEWDDDYEY